MFTKDELIGFIEANIGEDSPVIMPTFYTPETVAEWEGITLTETELKQLDTLICESKEMLWLSEAVSDFVAEIVAQRN